MIATLLDEGLHILLEKDDGSYEIISAPTCINRMGMVTQMRFTEDSLKALQKEIPYLVASRVED